MHNINIYFDMNFDNESINFDSLSINYMNKKNGLRFNSVNLHLFLQEKITKQFQIYIFIQYMYIF